MTATATTAPRTPPWDTVTCVTPLCSGCGASAGDEEEGYTPHFTTEQQAREQLTSDYGWRITTAPGDGEQLLCKTCAAGQDCARLGHQPRTASRTLMADGRTLGESSWCDRCGQLLSFDPGTPAPPGYPVPQPARQDLYWDAAACPAGHDLAGAAARLLARLSDTAIAARWDAWDGDQAGRPAPVAAPDLAADKAAALTLIMAAHQMFTRAAAASAGSDG